MLNPPYSTPPPPACAGSISILTRGPLLYPVFIADITNPSQFPYPCLQADPKS